jgi:cytochrome P450
MDVMKDFATPLPLFVIAQMMGMPFEDRKFIRSMAEKLLFIGRGEADRMQPLTDGIKELMEYLSPLVAQKVDLPVDENDLLSVLASGEKTGALTRDEVIADAILLLLAGHETTINLICNGTLAFTQHPDQWKLLKEAPFQDPDTVVRATEECLRYDPPVKSIQRIASEDVEMGGKLLKEGDRIRWFMSSANRDPAKHENPDTFDISRWPNTHVAFGSGIHHCLGATLARMEAQEAFKALAGRYDSISQETDEYEYQPSVTFRSLKSLPVSLK